MQPGANLFQCLCAPGYTDTFCSTNINDCSPVNPCKNAGTCIDLVNSYACNCAPGYFGADCSNQFDPCSTQPCVYGTCQRINANQYQCICSPGVTGTNCQQFIDPCLSTPCINHGTCVSLDRTYTCQCPFGVTGQNCELIIDQCLSQPCLNGGLCTQPSIGMYQCSCSNLYTGRRCEIRLSSCTPGLCQNGGTCLESTNALGYSCQCQLGFDGQICQNNINECLSSPCLNGGSCFDQINGYQCFCSPGYNGLHCEIETNDCSSSPCVTGQCLTVRPFGYTCACPQGRTGLQCEQRINECNSNPCQNGGFCSQLNPFGFQCTCLTGYQGMYCEIVINVCDSNPCLNGATCVQATINAWQCQCRCGFTGARCEALINECANNPCLNGGTCTKPKPCGFICACPQEPVGFSGPLCENRYLKVARAQTALTQIFSREETLYFSGEHLAKLKFADIEPNVLRAYNTENVNSKNICPPTFDLIGTSSCYRLLSNKPYDRDEAHTECLLHNAELAWFASKQDVDLVRAWLNTFTTQSNDIWTGGMSSSQQYKGWQWDFNNTIIPDVVLEPNWAPNKPDMTDAKKTSILLSSSNGYLFTNEAPNKRLYSTLCRRDAFVFDSVNSLLDLKAPINAVDERGNGLVGFKFVTNVSSLTDNAIERVFKPSEETYAVVFNRFPIEYGTFYSGKAYTFNSPFILSFCNELTASQIEQIKQSVLSAWYQLHPTYEYCKCFEIFVIQAERYIGINNQVNTQISYLAKYNDVIIEAMSTDLPQPTTRDVFDVLEALGFTQCQARNRRRALLDVNVAKASLNEADLKELKETVETSLNAVRPDFSINKKNVAVNLISNSEAIDANSKLAVTQVYLQVTVDNQLLDFYTQTEFDTQRLIDELNYQNENKSLTVLDSPHVYSRNYFFTLISSSKVDKLDYPLLEKRVLSIFLDNYKQFKDKNVTVATTWQEEYLDEAKNIVYGLSILISLDNTPIENIITLDRSIFNKLTTVDANEGLLYSFSLPSSGAYLHQLSKALTFYSKILICRRDYAKIEYLVQAIASTYQHSKSLFSF